MDWAPVDIIHRYPSPRAQHPDGGKKGVQIADPAGSKPPVTCPDLNFEARCAWPLTHHSAEVLSHAHRASSGGITKQNWHIDLILPPGDII